MNSNDDDDGDNDSYQHLLSAYCVSDTMLNTTNVTQSSKTSWGCYYFYFYKWGDKRLNNLTKFSKLVNEC